MSKENESRTTSSEPGVRTHPQSRPNSNNYSDSTNNADLEKSKNKGAMKLILFCIFVPILIIVGLYSLILYYSHGGNPDFIQIDSCLDQGGQWDYTKKMCEK